MTADELFGFLMRQRWYRGKARTRVRADIVETIPMDWFSIALLRVEYADGAAETYQLAIADGQPLADSRVSAALLSAMVPGSPPYPARVLGVEQSNTSIAYGDRYIAKIYRVIDDEPSIEIEMARFLTAHGYRGSPKFVAALEHGGRSLAVMFDFVANRGDAWKLATEGDPDAFAGHAKLLGKRTAELHAALASEPNDPAFAPEPISREDLDELATHVRAGLQRTIALVPVLASRRPAIERALALAVAPGAVKTRTHGDYHLGQVLWNGSDFAIIDFEGEPSAPIAERRAKRSPLRDVAGMLRSIDYAGAVGKRERAWVARSQASFLQGYGRVDDAIVRFFTIEKALYEIAYEANNRPDWVDIPLRGLLALVEGK